MVVITGTDRLNHFLWNAYEDQNHPRHEAFINYYQQVDQFVGRTYEKFLALNPSGSGENHFVMLSDHGFEGIRLEVYLNEWLKQEGLLSFGSKQPESLEDISEGSKAFALDPSRIYINSKGRYPKGSVEPGDVEKIKEEIRSGLKDLTSGEDLPVVRRIFDGDEIYQGPLTSQGPDLVLLSNSGFDLKGKLASPTLFGRTVLQGKHTHDDAFVYSSKGKEAKTIFELKKLILDER
jgi:predicted AlkP superfamily phosphohydrolase/phosphomutase